MCGRLAKGLPERVILVRHALRNALLPTITVLALDVGWLIGGIVVVERSSRSPAWAGSSCSRSSAGTCRFFR